MPTIGAAELILILLIAFVVVGPKDLPKIARALGRGYKRIRAMINELKEETGLDEVEADIKQIERETKATTEAIDIRKDLQQVQLDTNKEINQIKKELSFKDFKNQMGGK